MELEGLSIFFVEDELKCPLSETRREPKSDNSSIERSFIYRTEGTQNLQAGSTHWGQAGRKMLENHENHRRQSGREAA